MTVKEFITQEQTGRGSHAELNLSNPHLSNLQNNEIVFVEGVPHIKTSIIFGGSQAADTVAKIEDLEIKNSRLELELSYLQVKYESARMRSEALQNYLNNSTTEFRAQEQRRKNEIIKLRERMKPLKDKNKSLNQQNQQIRQAITALTQALENKIDGIVVELGDMNEITKERVMILINQTRSARKAVNIFKQALKNNIKDIPFESDFIEQD